MDDVQLRKELGQLFIVGFTGLTASEHIKSLIRAPYYIGAIVLFQRNVESAEQLLSLVNELQQTAKDAGHQRPLLIGIDQENGLVTRIKPPVAPQLPGSMAIGATGSIESALRVSKATGELLDFFGINMNYAPCCDVNSEPVNPVIGVRSPSDDGETVGRVASAMARGLREQGIVPCVKHFPGHGDTSVDSHYGLPTVTRSRESLEMCDLVPFRRAAAECIEAMMTAHIVVPSLDDSGLPMTLSPKLVNMLRQQLQYNGLIITDCLEMDAIRAHFGTAAGALKSLQAGADCVMICHTRDVQVDAFETIFTACKNGDMSTEHLLQSAKRVQDLKSKFLTWEDTLKPRSVSPLRELYHRQESIARDLYSRSTTLVRDNQNALSLTAQSSIVYVYPLVSSTRVSAAGSGETEVRVPSIPPAFADTLRTYTPRVTEVPFYDGFQIDEKSETLISQADAVILVTRNAQIAAYQKEMGVKLAKIARKLVTVAACDPYDFIDCPEVSTNIAIYEPTPEAFHSALDIIFGSAKPMGRLPVLNDPAKKLFAIEHFNNDRDMAPIVGLWQALLPEYGVPADRLVNLLSRPNGKHFVARIEEQTVGYVATFTDEDRPTGFISALLVDSAYQRQGIGTALINKAREHLRTIRTIKSVTIGSSSPRFWPGVPLDIPEKAQNFFLHRGFCPTPGPTARDYTIDLQTYTSPEAIMQRASDSGITFTPWREDLYQECMRNQKEIFGKDPVWVGAYERLAQAKQHHQAMVALDSSGKQLGWTLMLEPNIGLSADLAFPPLLGEKTGQIGCVGVHTDARKRGVGLALVASAALDLKRRGMEKVFIDWVALVNWYEKAGCEVWREYRPMELKEGTM